MSYFIVRTIEYVTEFDNIFLSNMRAQLLTNIEILLIKSLSFWAAQFLPHHREHEFSWVRIFVTTSWKCTCFLSEQTRPYTKAFENLVLLMCHISRFFQKKKFKAIWKNWLFLSLIRIRKPPEIVPRLSPLSSSTVSTTILLIVLQKEKKFLKRGE